VLLVQQHRHALARIAIGTLARLPLVSSVATAAAGRFLRLAERSLMFAKQGGPNFDSQQI
jgi:hypothetical protein